MAGAPILVVDDAPVNLKLMRMLLTHAGYDVRTAACAEDALEMLSDYRPELILADIQLPGMNGLEMTRQVKNDPRTSAIKVVALTACAMKEDRDRALNAGCDDYISKPIDTAVLASKVGELLARPAAEPTALRPASLDMEAMRRQFLADGSENTRDWLANLDSGLDQSRVAGQLHQWVGSAGLLGYSQISELARHAETMLLREPVETDEVREALVELVQCFSTELDSEFPPAKDYTEALAGKRVALVGFSSKRADFLCTLLEQAKARARLFEAAEGPASLAIQNCDLVLFHARPETRHSEWFTAPAADAAPIKLVLMGEQRELVAMPAALRARAIDFLVGRTETQEVMMRLAFAVSRDLPRAAEAIPAAPVAPVRARTTVTNPRVVLADDDSIVHALVGATLQNHGMTCRTAQNGHDALNLIRSEQPHAAVLDVNMPGMDGFQVLAAIRAEKIPTRVILLTALGQEKDVLRAFDLGADDYLRKPFNPFELVARLKRLMQ